MSCSRLALTLVALLAPAARAGAPPAAAPGGTITGKVDLVKLAVGSRMGDAGEVIVYLEDGPPPAIPAAGDFTITQGNKTFEPNVLVVPVGAKVTFPNMDELTHNVFSSAPGSTFDLGLYKSGVARSATFARPGVVPIFCNIHPQMVAYVLVVTNDFNTRAAGDGSYALRGVPPGTYTLVAWSPSGRGERRTVSVTAGGTTRADLVVRERAGVQDHRNKEGKPYGLY